MSEASRLTGSGSTPSRAIAVKNGILVIEFTRQLREEGLPVRDALLRAGPMRLRTILMTTCATDGGMPPLARIGENPRMTVRRSRRLDCLPRYEPGLTTAEVLAAYGLERAIKLASNESPFAPLPEVERVLAAGAAGLNRYPDGAARAAGTSLHRHGPRPTTTPCAVRPHRGGGGSLPRRTNQPQPPRHSRNRCAGNPRAGTPGCRGCGRDAGRPGG